MQSFVLLEKRKKILHPKKTQNFTPLKICKKPTQLPKLQQTPTKSLQNPTKIKGRKIPELPPYEPEKAFEIPLQNQHFSKTRHQRSSSNRQQKQRTEKVGKKSPLDQLFHPLEFVHRFFGKR